MDADELSALVSDLRAEGSDFAEVEVKRAAGGFPQSAVNSLCAFANTPGGGTLILGLDESDGFRATGVADPAQQQASLAAMARQGLVPPITFDSEVFQFEGATVVVAHIDELPSSQKPCRVSKTGKAYLRSYDGDYELSELEEQAFLANRETPRFDQASVPGASHADLDSTLVNRYIEQCRLSPALARFSDEEMLVRTGVISSDGIKVTVAGLLALGVYPQQYFPNFAIQASVVPDADAPEGTRAIDPRRFDGPIPLIMDEALAWIRRNTRTRVVFGRDGHGRDEPEYPAQAVRELLSNALVHRDLGPHAAGQAITIRIEKSRLVMSNPGGLWGIAASQLGKTGVTSARNGYLVRICQNVRTRGDERVVEALATGIPTVLSNLQRAGMVPPQFNDQGIRFAVIVPNHTLLAKSDLDWLATLPDGNALSDTQKHVLVAMRQGATWTNRTVRAAFPMDSRDARSLLLDLVYRGLARAEGEKGSRVYVLAEDEEDMPEQDENAALASESVGAERGSEPDSDLQPELWGDEPEEEVVSRKSRLENAEAIATFLGRGPASIRELMDELDLTYRQVSYALAHLRQEGVVALIGRQGDPGSRYGLTAGSADA